MRAKFVAAFAAVLTLFLAFASSANADFEPYGVSGGMPFKASCPANQYVAGFFGRVGGWLDDVGLICAPTIGTTSFGDPVQSPQFFGGLGGGTTSTQCDKGTVVKYIHYFVQYDRANSDAIQYIRGISIDCAHADGTTASNKCFGICHDGETSHTIGAEFGITPTGQVDNNCAPGLMTGLNGRTNQYVVALGALCGPLPKAVTVVASNAGQPIKTTGGNKITDSVMICQGGGMTIAPVSGTTASFYLSFAAAPQGANTAQPAPGQCAWSSGPLSGAFKKFAVGSLDPKFAQLQQAAQSGGSFILEAHPLGGGTIYVDRIDNVQLASGSESGTGGTVASGNANANASPAGSGYALDCQGGGDMNISGGGAVLGGSSFFNVSFGAAPQGSNASPPGPGTCAWQDRALRPGEPLVLQIPNQLSGIDVLKQAIDGGTFEVNVNTVGKVLLVNQVDDVQVASGQSGGSAAGSGGDQGAAGTGTGAGTTAKGSGASVLMPPIAEDNGSGTPAIVARAVNVHTAASGGSVIGSLGAGTAVTNLGCSKGWCHVAFPGGQGFVAQSFLGPQ